MRRFGDAVVSLLQDQTIAARVALTVGAKTFDRLFSSIHFAESQGEFLFVYAKDEGTAAKIEDRFAFHISTIASRILEQDIRIVMVLPNEMI